MVFKCSMCPVSYTDYLLYWRHISRHEHDLNFVANCGIYSCTKRYNKLNSLRYHIRNKHKEFHQTDFPIRNTAISQVHNPQEHNNYIDNRIDTDLVPDVDIDREDNCEEVHGVDFEGFLAHFFLELRELKKVSGEACSFVAINMGKIVSLTWTLRSQKIKEKLEELSIFHDELNSLLDEEETQVFPICEKFSSMKNLNKYIIDHSDGNFVGPEEVLLGYDNNKQETCQYVPILKTLDVLMKKTDIFHTVTRPTKSYPQSDIKSFSDGILFKENKLFSKRPSSLQIVVYSDEFVPVNPLGNKQKQYKITSFYFVLGNLDRKNRAQLKMINLLLLCTAKLVAKYGYEKVLRPLLKDISRLELDGMNIQLINGLPINIRGTISLLVCDNLAAHTLGGYYESFGPLIKRICRYCNGDRDAIKRDFKCTDFIKRTQETYDYQVSIVEQDDCYAKEYGIKVRSPFNILQFFHVSGRQPFDVFHDIFEGFGKVVLNESLKKLISKGYFTIADINLRIDAFEYAAFERRDKPEHIRTPKRMCDFSVKMKAVETSNFIRIIPLLIGDFVPENDTVWALLMQFIQLVQVIMSPVFNKGECQYLSDLTEEFLSSFFSYFDDVNVTPKSHFLVHYSSQILETGPPIDHDTVRFEGKHNYFKEVYNRSKNRINIVKSLATRHQFFMYLHHRKNLLLTPDDPTASNTTIISTGMISNNDIRRCLAEALPGKTMISLHDTVKFEGITFSKGTAVVIDYSDDIFQFGYILHCLFDDKTLIFLCQKLETLYFNEHFNSYQVEFKDNFQTFKVADLLDINPLGVYKVDSLPDSWFVPLKHYLRIPDEVPTSNDLLCI